ncbi:MAG TPA: CYTH domain-containing protein [Acidobacteriota bacterium]|nr:CYTH domain-containing protein [Acidobacteriota bacterium]
MNIEVEVRSFITKEQYERLLAQFHKNAKFLKEDYQETFYFDCEEDLRIQRNNYFAKVWMKKGKLHDDHREEIEVKISKEDFESLEKLFLALGYNTQIKWFRKRVEFKWNDITVCMDDTRGYGYIIELEKMSTPEGKHTALEELKNKMSILNVAITPKEEFEKAFKNYKEHWRTLTE